jgi:hypothetical protein
MSELFKWGLAGHYCGVCLLLSSDSHAEGAGSSLDNDCRLLSRILTGVSLCKIIQCGDVIENVSKLIMTGDKWR